MPDVTDCFLKLWQVAIQNDQDPYSLPKSECSVMRVTVLLCVMFHNPRNRCSHTDKDKSRKSFLRKYTFCWSIRSQVIPILPLGRTSLLKLWNEWSSLWYCMTQVMAWEFSCMQTAVCTIFYDKKTHLFERILTASCTRPPPQTQGLLQPSYGWCNSLPKLWRCLCCYCVTVWSFGIIHFSYFPSRARIQKLLGCPPYEKGREVKKLIYQS